MTDPIWIDLIQLEVSNLRSIFSAWAAVADKAGSIRHSLDRPQERGTALRILLLAGDEPLQRSIFKEVVELASVGHADIVLCRLVIQAMSREWVLRHIATVTDPVLQNGGEEEFRRYAELFRQLDDTLFHSHVTRMHGHADVAVRDAAADYRASIEPNQSS